VSFVEPASGRALFDIRRLPGVLYAEPMRAVPVRLRAGQRSRIVSINGLLADSELNRVIDVHAGAIRLPPEGLVLSLKLAEVLGARRGDVVTLEVLDGRRPVRQVAVAGIVEEYMGTSAYMEIDALRELVRDGPTLSGAFLKVDRAQETALYEQLKCTPAVAGVSLKRSAIESFNKTLKETFYVMIFFNLMFSGVIAFGVVYNAARVSLSERTRELASLRVLGFTRGEISFILLAELALLTAAALPLGAAIGYALGGLIMAGFSNEIYRLSFTVRPATIAWSFLTVIAAAALSALAVRRRLDRLDLVAVLKVRE
jgi:putative ABC transport system permease protein